MVGSVDNNTASYLGSLIGAPVTVTSGYRDPQHNALVGGVPNSAHLTGQAYDFVPQGMDMATAQDRIVKSGVPFDQVINEGDHIHVSFDPKNRKQVLNTKMANASDDQILQMYAEPSQAPAKGNVSDDQILSEFGSSPATSQESPNSSLNPPNSPKPTNFIAAKPFTLGDEVTAHIPFAKDIVAGGTGALDALTGHGSLAGNYQTNLASLNQQQAEYEKQNPGLSTLGGGIGVLAAGAPSKLASGATTLWQLIKEGAKGGATLGALFGAGTPQEGQQTLQGRAGNAVLGAATGAPFGAAVPVVGAGVAQGGRAVGKVVNKLVPSADEMAARRAQGIIENFAGGKLTPNASELVPGSKPTLPEATGNPGAAGLYRALRDLNPNSPLVTREGQNHLARAAYYESIAKTPDEIEALEDARGAAAAAARKKIFEPPIGADLAPGATAAHRAVDTTPVNKVIDDILSGSSGERPAVVKAMADAKEMLAGKNGAITDPQTLYDSTRKGINDLISGKDLTKQYGATAAAQLIKVRDALDDAIETKAPGFKDYLKNYEEASGPIDALKFLQGQNLTDASGKITLAKVQGALQRLETQQNAPGIKLGKAVTDEQRAALEKIRDDLLRAQNTSLGKSIGSNTVQNALAQKRLGISRFIPEGVGATAGSGIGYYFGGQAGAEAGGLLGDRLGAMVGHLRANRDAQAQALLQSKLEDMLLNPGEYQNPTISASQMPSLNQIMSGNKARLGQAALNRLVIPHLAAPRERR